MSHYYHPSNHKPWRQSHPCSVAICIHCVVVTGSSSSIFHHTWSHITSQEHTPSAYTCVAILMMLVMDFVFGAAMSPCNHHTLQHTNITSQQRHIHWTEANLLLLAVLCTACRYSCLSTVPVVVKQVRLSYSLWHALNYTLSFFNTWPFPLVLLIQNLPLWGDPILWQRVQ